MKKRRIGMRIAAMLLAIMMMVPMSLLEVAAAVGDLSNVSTGLTGDINTNDTISLPIKILDYENDGMLFEYAEAYADAEGREVGASKKATDFGATWAADFASQTAVGNVTTSMYGDFWANTTKSLNTGNSYASYLRATWKQNSTQVPHTVYGRTGVIMPNDLNLSMDNARYLVMVYRSNVASGKIGFFVERENSDRNETRNRVGDLSFTNKGDTGEGSTTNWTYAVYDLKQGNLANNWTGYGNAIAIWTTLPMDGSGEYIDLAHVALFANEDQAEAFGEYALTDGSDRGDNRGFGLLRSSRNQAGGNNYAGIVDQTTTVEQLNTYGDTSSIDFSTLTTLGYTLLGTFGEKGIANVGLLESSLSKDGYPVYKQEVVTYVANLLKHSLEIPERTSDGWKNYRYVKGTASSIYGDVDLATALRNKINGNMGTYAAAAGKDLVGTWSEVSGNIASYYDAAYFLLNSIFVPGSYNEEQSLYNYLVLSSGTDTESEDKVYVFDGGFATSATPASAEMAIDYNTTNHTIQNTSAAGKAHFVYEGTSTTTLNPFLPVTDDNIEAGMTQNPYHQDDGVINGVKKQTTKDTLYKRDFNFAMVSEGEFVYHADDELFFDFEGDDDVYLFINNELVMDIGSAHSIDGVRFELNDYVNAAKTGTLGSDARNKALALEEGNTYSFKFYYMERHSYGSNIRVETNIRVTDPSMLTAKPAWQDGTQLDFGSIVDKDKVVEYGFAITNNGEENLYNLTFADNDIGVKLDPEKGLTVTGKRVYDINGGTLEASDLIATVSHPKYTDITVTFADNHALIKFLQDLTATGTDAGAGLFVNATVMIRGIGYKLSDDQIQAGVFDNTVLTTSTNKTKSKTLQGQATMRVFVPADPMYYEWAGHDLKVTKTKLIEDVLAAANQEGNLLAGKVPSLTTKNIDKIELTTKAGTAISSKEVIVDSSYNLTINYPTPGSKVFYVKVTYNSSKNSVIVPVLVNVTDVKDSVYVLDYGLKVDLTENSELTKNDDVTVPGRGTKNDLIAIGSDGAYSPNEITFTSNDEDTIVSEDGTFKLSGNTLTYSPTDFMDGVDSIQVALNVYEDDITPSKISGAIDINNEVEMYKNISVLPANVVYYEDDFPAIKYTTNKDDDSVENVFGPVNEEGSSNLTQSNDQTTNYGSDDVYSDSTNDEYSGNSLTKITIYDNDVTASFKFKGTGFELIGRTNAYDSATLTVKVYDASHNRIKTIPVITEFDNGADGGKEEIYQVPVIRVKDLELGEYTVEISGVPARDYDNVDEDGNPTIIPTVLYIDGLRIYQPLGESHEDYLETESGATFLEIRDEIVEGKVAVTEWNGEEFSVSTGLTTWTENYDANDYDGTDSKIYTANQVDNVDSYLLEGPNNEVYMLGDYTDSAIVFYVKETGDGVHNLQIGVHAVDEGLFVGTDSIGMNTEIKYGTGDSWEPVATVTSGTEQYYTIDYKNCPYDEKTERYQVVIKIESGMASFTNIKLNGLEIPTIDGMDAPTVKFENGLAVGIDENGNEVDIDLASMPALYSLRSQMMASVSAEPETPIEPEIPENPGTTEEPEIPTEPETPEKPETPEEPETPEKPKSWFQILLDKLFGFGKDDDKEEKPESTEEPEEGTPEEPESTEKPEEGDTEIPDQPGNSGNNSGNLGIFGWFIKIIGSWFK